MQKETSKRVIYGEKGEIREKQVRMEQSTEAELQV